MISLKDIQPYAKGYRLFFEIGNPNSIIYNNIHVVITYGKNEEDLKGKAFLLEAKKYETDIYKDMIPGYWNEVIVTLSPLDISELGTIWMEIEPKIVKLKSLND